MTHSSTHHIRPNSMVLYNHMIVSYILEALNKKRVYTTESPKHVFRSLGPLPIRTHLDEMPDLGRAVQPLAGRAYRPALLRTKHHRL